MKFSIIIPAKLYNSYLFKTLKKIENQKYQNYEVIVILDFQEDLHEEFDSRYKFLFSGIKSPGEKRNLGINESNGDYVCFLDDDAYPDTDWLEVAAKNLIDTDLVGVCGPSITPPESSFLEKVSGSIYESFLVSGPTIFRHLPDKKRFVKDYPSVNMIVSKKALEEIGGFDINFWPGEDTKLCLEIYKKHNKELLYIPELVVFHFRREIFHPHINQLSRYAFHRGYFSRVLPETSKKLSYMIPSIFLLYLIFLPFILFLQLFFLLTPLLIYLTLLAFEMFRVYNKTSSIAHTILFGIGVFLSHVFYGFNYLKGLVLEPKMRLRDINVVTEKYING